MPFDEISYKLSKQALQCSALVGEIKMYAGNTAPNGFLLCNGSSKLRTDYPNLFCVIGTAYGSVDENSFNLPDLRSRMPIGAGQGVFETVFSNTAVNISTNAITVNSNDSLYNGTIVVLSTTGTAPTGLTAGSTYYVIKDSDTSIRLATTVENAVAGSAIDITGQGTGSHTLTITYKNRTLGNIGGSENHTLVISEMPSHYHTIDDNYGVQNLEATFNNGTACDEITRGENTSNTGGSQPHNNTPLYSTFNFIIKY